MASALAQEPQLVAQVLHSDRFTTDSLLGTASIPLVQLMHKPMLDGFAPVLCQSGNTGSEADRSIVGALRVVLSMEDLGPVRMTQDKSQKSVKQSGSQLHKSASVGTFDNFFENLRTEYSYVGRGPSREGMKDRQVDPSNGAEIAQSGNSRKPLHEEHQKDERERVQNAPIENPLNDTNISPNLATADPQKHPVYELAWEFEMWRRSEEAKWRQDLQEKELQALSNLERNWLKKENEMVYQIQKIEEENIGLEQKLRVKLMQLEKREKALVLAEEHFSFRREALERDLQQHNTDAQVAVKRIQAECEHRLELGQLKYAALEDQYKTLDKRFGSTSASLVTLEKQFSELKAAYRNTSEAGLTAKVLSLQQQCSDLQQKSESLVQTRGKYKEQVLRMAKELASLQHLKFREEAKKMEDQDRDEDVWNVAALVEEHARRAQEDRQELRLLKEQLEGLGLRGISGEASAATQPQKNESKLDQLPVELLKQEVKDRKPQDIEGELLLKEASTASCIGRAQQTNSAAAKEIDGSSEEVLSEETLSVPTGDDTCNMEESMRAAEAHKLSMHKLNLLSSGLYTVNDPLILGLDHEIVNLRSGTKKTSKPSRTTHL